MNVTPFLWIAGGAALFIATCWLLAKVLTWTLGSGLGRK